MMNSPEHSDEILSLSLCCCTLWRVVMSVVINMTNHFQLILFPWYMPFEATLQAQLGVAHHVDLLHKHWIISPSYLAALIIHRQPTLLCMCCIQILAGMTYIAFQKRNCGFFISRAGFERSPSVTSSLWLHPHPIIMKWPRFPQTLEPRQRISAVWIVNAAPSDWPEQVFHFSLKLSISLLLHIPITKLVTIGCSTHRVVLLGGEGSRGWGSCKGVSEISGKSIVISS